MAMKGLSLDHVDTMGPGNKVGGQRHFRGLELAVAQHAEKSLLHRHADVVEVYAVGLDPPFGKGPGTIVIPAAERYLEF